MLLCLILVTVVVVSDEAELRCCTCRVLCSQFGQAVTVQAGGLHGGLRGVLHLPQPWLQRAVLPRGPQAALQQAGHGEQGDDLPLHRSARGRRRWVCVLSSRQRFPRRRMSSQSNDSPL